MTVKKTREVTELLLCCVFLLKPDNSRNVSCRTESILPWTSDSTSTSSSGRRVVNRRSEAKNKKKRS